MGLTALGVLTWHWRSSLAAKRTAEQRLGMAYISGPLSDAVMALSRADEEGDEAQAAIERSIASLKGLLDSAATSQTKKELEACLPLLQELQLNLEGHLAAVEDGDKELLAKNRAQNAAKLAALAEILRYRAFNEWRLTDTQKLEINALIYSLKETLGTKP